MKKVKWIFCPVCGGKTRTMIREDTSLKQISSG
ncbi:MAG: cysteine-rich KTR domain-containing protein [Lachnospiraceae bacterium]